MSIRMSHLAVAGALAAAIAGAGLNARPGQAASGGISCQVVAENSGGGTEVRAIARSPGSVGVSYNLTVRSGGNGNTSNIVQSGDATLRSGADTQLTVVTLGGTGNYTATLKVTWPGGQTTCQHSGSA